jgi:hypothetical protein
VELLLGRRVARLSEAVLHVNHEHGVGPLKPVPRASRLLVTRAEVSE